MLAIIQSRTFFLLVCCWETKKIKIYNTIILPVVLYGCETWVSDIKGEGVVGWGDVDWIGLAQDRKRWRALVNLVLNLQIP
jgi:hypothetical protein